MRDSVKWPYNASGGQVALGIAWGDADPLAFQAKPHIWRKVSKEDAEKLRRDPRLTGIFRSLSPEIQEVVNAVAEARAAHPATPASSPKKRTVKDDMIDRIEQIIADAESDDDITGRLKGVEMLAKIHALLNQKQPDEERQVTINVITGVQRD
jgi:hypothetical protein